MVDLSRVLYTMSGAPPVQPDGTPLLQTYTELKWHRDAWLQSLLEKTPNKFAQARGLRFATYESLLPDTKN